MESGAAKQSESKALRLMDGMIGALWGYAFPGAASLKKHDEILTVAATSRDVCADDNRDNSCNK